MQLVQAFGSIDLAGPLNQVGNSLVDALRTDTRNIFAGAVTLTQPLYMGGKIRAYNKITKYAEELARQQHSTGMQEVILNTDQAYWQVVSLVHKKKLAEGYLELLKKLESDVDKMINEGVATKADGLSVKVKVNEAEMTLTKVDDGLSLSRMLLCQLCGLQHGKCICHAPRSAQPGAGLQDLRPEGERDPLGNAALHRPDGKLYRHQSVGAEQL